MLWLIRFMGLLSQAIFLEFLHIFGLIVFLLAVLLGYFRAPWWIAPVLAVACGLFANWFIDLNYLTDVFRRVASSNDRWAFVIVVYLAITIGGYLIGLLGRLFLRRVRRP
ncbi:MAG: hypothetical protein FD139_3475 [Methylocystaceae bacterium]|nr:MAG: hypothetical protein FD172_4045 [Methylocystaceae bacterium]TXT42656.1 MAG: hypothetical protein FD139_3475 [Methylocystaceae bacterium]